MILEEPAGPVSTLALAVAANFLYGVLVWARQRWLAVWDRRGPLLRPISFGLLGLVWFGGNWAALSLWDVHSAWLFPVAAISFLFFTLYEFGQFWRVGLYGADAAVATGIDYARSLRLATNAFEFLGTGANKLSNLSEFEPAMQRCHRDDRAIRFLLLDPRDHIGLSDAAKRAGHDDKEYQRRVGDSLKRIADLRDRRSLNMEVRFYRDAQPFRLVFIDGVLCLFGYNVYGEGEDFKHPQLHVVSHRSRRDVGSFYYPLRSHFEDLWERAVSWNPKEWQ